MQVKEKKSHLIPRVVSGFNPAILLATSTGSTFARLWAETNKTLNQSHILRYHSFTICFYYLLKQYLSEESYNFFCKENYLFYNHMLCILPPSRSSKLSWLSKKLTRKEILWINYIGRNIKLQFYKYSQTQLMSSCWFNSPWIWTIPPGKYWTLWTGYVETTVTIWWRIWKGKKKKKIYDTKWSSR